MSNCICCLYRIATSTRPWSFIATSTSKVVLSFNRQLVLIRPLVTDVLRYPREVRGAATWGAELRDSAATAEESRLIRTVIDSASGPLDWSK